MVSRIARIVAAAVVVLASLFLASLVLAQEASGPPAPALNWSNFVQAMFAAALPFLVLVFRALLPKLPRAVVWMLPPLFGTLIQWLLAVQSVPGMAAWKGVLAGLVAISLREFVSTVKEHGLNG